MSGEAISGGKPRVASIAAGRPFLPTLVDALFDGGPFRSEHYPLALFLPVLFLLFSWAREVRGTHDVPYSFLQTRTADCFVNYTLLFLAHLAAFVLPWTLCLVRDSLAGVEYTDRHRVGEPKESEHGSSAGERRPARERDVHSPSAPSDMSSYLYAHDDESFDVETLRTPESVPRFSPARRPQNMSR